MSLLGYSVKPCLKPASAEHQIPGNNDHSDQQRRAVLRRVAARRLAVCTAYPRSAKPALFERHSLAAVDPRATFWITASDKHPMLRDRCPVEPEERRSLHIV